MTLREFFDTTDISIIHFSKMCGYTQPYLHSLMRGKHKASKRCLEALFRASKGKITEV